jgi:hypothetical protein
MALEIKFNLCETPTCTRLTFTDQTGEYDALTNPTGYDQTSTVNPATTDFENAVLEIITPDNLVYVFSDSVISSISGIFYDPTFPGDSYPNTDTEVEYQIAAQDIGYNPKVKDGVYKVSYKLIDSVDGELSTTKYFLLTCQVECCIDKLYGKVNPVSCDCGTDSSLKAAMEAEGYVCAAKAALACGKISKAKQLLQKAESVCASLNCKCC